MDDDDSVVFWIFRMKKRILPPPKAKPKPQDNGGVLQRSVVSVEATPPPAASVSVVQRVSSPPEPICLSDSLDEDLTAPSLDSISHALAMLSSAAKGLVQSDGPLSTDGAKPTLSASLHASPHLSKKTSASPSPPTVLSSPSVRSETVKGVSVLSQTQRHSVAPAQRPAVTPGGKMGVPSVPAVPKPRPPPTSSPLHAPQKILGVKTVVAMPTGLIKTSNNSGGSRVSVVDAVSRAHTLPTVSSPSYLNIKTVQPFHLTATSQAKNTPSPSQAKPTHHQPGFITPMQATITKSPHNSSSPIIKLTPTASPTSRPPTLPSMHQHASKSPGLHTGFSAGVYSSPVGQKTTSQGNNISNLTTTTSSVTKQPVISVSPAAGTANHSQRHRQAGGANQGVKTITSVSTATAAAQLSQV